MDDSVDEETADVEHPNSSLYDQVEDVTEQKIDRETEKSSEPFCFPAVENLNVLDEDGNSIRMGEIYMKRKTILIFVRVSLSLKLKDCVVEYTIAL